MDVEYFFRLLRHHIRNISFETLFIFCSKVIITCEVIRFILDCVKDVVLAFLKSQ